MTGLPRILGHNATDPSDVTESAVSAVIELVSVNMLFMDASLQHSTAGLAQRCRAVPSEVTGRLLDAAVSSFARHGFAGARVSEIARRAGLTTGAIYARWPSKADLLAAAVDHALCAILPARRFNDLDAAPMRPHDMIAMFNSGIAGADQARGVTIQAAGSAAASDAIAAALAGFLNEEAQQLGCIIEAGKDAGIVDPDLDTTALALLCQAVGIGAHLVRSAGLDESHVPAEDKWDALVAKLIGGITTAEPRPAPHPDD